MLRLAILALMLLAIGCTTLTTADIEKTVDTAVAAALVEQKVVSAPGEATVSGIAPLPGAIASRAFIKIEGIQGESTDSGHKGEIDVLAWS
ncbi:MAG: type VI secretion system tube protein Hcp [Chloroflexi bacterium]|nr:type VI secretion system tube protein Hcp [Chloroflexota bacterium]